MLAEWSAECAADDPVLVVPWTSASDPAAASCSPRFVDLRDNPYDLDQIPEAEQHPALLQALRSLNATRSPVFTAKCDAWVTDEQELQTMRLNLDVAAADSTHGFASYLDLVWRERSLFVSFHLQEQRLDRLRRLLEPLDFPSAIVECILRPALVDLAGPQEGFSVSLYVKALGTSAETAYDTWSAALEAAANVLRSKEFSSV
jgi:hypothetical protein